MTTKELFIGQIQHECKCTLAAINSLPEDMGQLDIKNHPKARSPRQLLEHFLPHMGAMASSVESKVIQESPIPFQSKAEMAEYFQGQCDTLVSKLNEIDDNTFETANVDFIINPAKTITMPMVQMYYVFMFDMIHHRGQLSTYYRAMGARNPNIYGPSAEDIEEMMVAMAASN